MFSFGLIFNFFSFYLNAIGFKFFFSGKFTNSGTQRNAIV